MGVGFCVRVCTIGLSLFSALSFAGTHHHDDGDQKIYRFNLNDYQKDMRAITKLGVDVAGVNIAQKTVDLVLSSDELAQVQAIARLSPIDSFTSGPNDLDDKYRNPAEIDAELHTLAAQYDTIANVQSIGKSHQGRDIWAIKISDNVDSSESEEPAILFNSMHHAREIMTPEVALDTVEYLLKKYATDPQVKRWVDSNEIWVVPMLNPDGNNKVWTSNNYWRKNTREDHGVDLNRNYPYAWGTCNGSSPNKTSDTYRGPSAGSEPESQALMNLVATIRPVFDISYHSYSELVIYPFGCDGIRSATKDVVEGIGLKMASLLPKDGGKGNYEPGTSWELLYSVDGGDIDWMHGTYGVIPYVIEVNSTSQGFQPSYDQWRDRTVAKMRPAWQMLLNRLEESGVRGRVNLNSGRQSASVNVKVTSVTNPTLAPQNFSLKSDGTFHVILMPGTYSFMVTDGSNTLPEQTVVVGARRENIEFDF